MVTVVKVKDAQRAWGKGIVAIATAHANGGDYVGLATNHVNTLYAYQMGPVLFKPTLAVLISSDQHLKPLYRISLHQIMHAQKTKDLQ